MVFLYDSYHGFLVFCFCTLSRLVTKSSSPFAVVYANAAYTRLSGYDAHYVVGKSLYGLIQMHESLPCQQVSTLLDQSPAEEGLEKSIEELLRSRDVSRPFHLAYLACGTSGEGQQRQEPNDLDGNSMGNLLKCYISIAPIVRNLNRGKRTHQDIIKQPTSDSQLLSSNNYLAAATNNTNVCAYYLIQIIQENNPNISEYLKDFQQVTWNKTVG
jgi:hypothetical protein